MSLLSVLEPFQKQNKNKSRSTTKYYKGNELESDNGLIKVTDVVPSFHSTTILL